MVLMQDPQDRRTVLELYRAMHRFGSFPETRSIVKWLESELSRLDAANRDEEVDVVFRQRQGACQVLETILTMVAKAPKKIEALEQAVRNQPN
jgi:hypothetical protein